jgi:catechol-2,3-dioxygenase
MPISKTRIQLDVDDATLSAPFYEALFGSPPASQSPTTTVFELDSPAVVLVLQSRRRARRSPHSRFALFVTEPAHVGKAAIALRRAGVRLRVEDEGIEANDPDGNAWRVSFVPSVPIRSIVNRLEERPR